MQSELSNSTFTDGISINYHFILPIKIDERTKCNSCYLLERYLRDLNVDMDVYFVDIRRKTSFIVYVNFLNIVKHIILVSRSYA